MAARTETLTVTGLLSVFFGWLQSSRCDAQYSRRKRDCTRFARFEYEGGRVADMPRLTVEGADALPPAARYDVDQFRRWGSRRTSGSVVTGVRLAKGAPRPAAGVPRDRGTRQ